MQLKEESISITSTGSSQVYLSSQESGRLVANYGQLYTRARLRTLERLDTLPELAGAAELKHKLLFSVIVLAFRSVNQTIASTKQQVRQALQVGLSTPCLRTPNLE